MNMEINPSEYKVLIVDDVISNVLLIKGDTPHFDYVCMGVTQGVAQLNATGDR